MQLREIDYVLAIAEFKSFTKAAAHLHISQSALSQTISRLEEKLGVPIFLRQKDGISITSGGKILIEEGRKMIGIRNRIFNRLADADKPDRGKIVLGITPLYSRIYFPAIYPVFREMYPEVELVLIEAQGEEQERMLINSTIDLGIYTLPGKNKYLEYKCIYKDPMVLVTPADYPLNKHGYIDKATGEPFMDLKLFANEGFVIFRNSRYQRKVVLSICMEYGFVPDIVFETNYSEVILAMVSAGLGVGFITRTMFFRNTGLQKETNKVNYYNVIAKNAELSCNFAFLKDAYVSKAAMNFMQFYIDFHRRLTESTLG